MNIINGGAHADNGLEMQEFMIVPLGFDDVPEALRCGTEIFHTLKSDPEEGRAHHGRRRRGRLRAAPRLERGRAQAHHAGRSRPPATSRASRSRSRSTAPRASSTRTASTPATRSRARAAELVDIYAELCGKYPIVTIEDGFAEDDWDGWKLLTDKLGKTVQLVGDDLFVTNKERLARGIEKRIANAILIKLNQIGTLTETLDTIRLATTAGYTSIISHRSGETEDTFIADLAVATNAGQIKTGSLSRSDRIAKYNQLLRIGDELGDAQVYSGRTPFTKR